MKQQLQMVEFGVAGLEEVLLTFLAPKEALERFLADLRQQGLEVCEEPLIPGVVMTCRLGARSLQ